MTPTDRNILRGQNRNNVMSLAEKLNIPVVVQDLQPWHLYNCDEAFLSTTYPGPLQPIGKFNSILIGKELPGPLTKRIAKAYGDWVGVDVTGQFRLSKEEKVALDMERARLNRERTKLVHIPY
jgi:branched-subunit amino acid aminotransferase/4-amino-4-deoxychorismate lyase